MTDSPLTDGLFSERISLLIETVVYGNILPFGLLIGCYMVITPLSNSEFHRSAV